MLKKIDELGELFSAKGVIVSEAWQGEKKVWRTSSSPVADSDKTEVRARIATSAEEVDEV